MLPIDFNREKFIADIREKHSAILPADIDFYVEDGWLPVVADGLQQIQDFIEKNRWLHKAHVRQIKEKFGELRIYVRPRYEEHQFSDELATNLATVRDNISRVSRHTCEVCGDPGELDVIAGYHQTLCGYHADRRKAWISHGRPDEEWRK
ncbi:MAG: hypothetical protein JWM58_4311 [Rhizobium sp.]|nr:hypothetical protein [Rhizobium sp.]